MHNKNNLGEHYTYHLFCLVLQFCEALKQEIICLKKFVPQFIIEFQIIEKEIMRKNAFSINQLLLVIF